MTDSFVDTPAEPTDDRKQIVAAVLLGIAATLTALAAYNAALSDGDALQGYTGSNLALNDANSFYAQGNSTSASDQALFVEYANANFAGDSDRAEYLRTLMRPTLNEAIDWWNANEAAVTPFDDLDGNPYEVEDFATARQLEEQATAAFEEGSQADETGDIFELAAVFFALTLFFGGIATLFKRPGITNALLIGAGVTLTVGAFNLVRAF